MPLVKVLKPVGQFHTSVWRWDERVPFLILNDDPEERAVYKYVALLNSDRLKEEIYNFVCIQLQTWGTFDEFYLGLTLALNWEKKKKPQQQQQQQQQQPQEQQLNWIVLKPHHMRRDFSMTDDFSLFWDLMIQELFDALEAFQLTSGWAECIEAAETRLSLSFKVQQNGVVEVGTPGQCLTPFEHSFQGCLKPGLFHYHPH